MSPTRPRRIPSYRLHKPTGLAVVRLDGRDYYLGSHGTPGSHEKYRRLISEWLANGGQIHVDRRAHGVVGDDITINELLVSFWGFAETYYVKNSKPTGEQQALRYAMKPLAELYGPSHVNEFGPLALKAVQQCMIDNGLCRNLINARINRIRRIFKWGVANQLVDSLILEGIKALPPLRKGRSKAPESEPVKPVPQRHVKAVEPYVMRPIWAMIQLQLLTGMRPGEVTIMRADDLDTSGSIWVYTPESHKTEHHGVERFIYVGPQAQRVLHPFIKRSDLTAYVFDPSDGRREYLSRLGVNANSRSRHAKRVRNHHPKRAPGDHYRVDSYCHAIQRACDRAGVPQWSPNQLRHNAATFLRKEYGIDVARVILGHSSPAVTEVYAELDRTKAMQVMAEVG